MNRWLSAGPYRLVAVVVLLAAGLAVVVEVGVRTLRRRQEDVVASAVDLATGRLSEQVIEIVGEQIVNAAVEHLVESSLRPATNLRQLPSARLPVSTSANGTTLSIDLAGILRSVGELGDDFRQALNGLGQAEIAFSRSTGDSTTRPAGAQGRAGFIDAPPDVRVDGSKSSESGGSAVTIESIDCRLTDDGLSVDAWPRESLSFAIDLAVRFDDGKGVQEKIVLADGRIRGWLHASGQLAWCRGYDRDGQVIWQAYALPNSATEQTGNSEQNP